MARHASIQASPQERALRSALKGPTNWRTGRAQNTETHPSRS